MEKQLSNLMIGVFLVAIVTIGISSFQHDIAQNYGLNTTNITYMQETDVAMNNTQDLMNTLSNTKIDPLSFVMIGGWQALQLVFHSGGMLMNVAADMITAFGLPSWVAVPIIGIIGVVLIFAVLYAIFKVRM